MNVLFASYFFSVCLISFFAPVTTTVSSTGIKRKVEDPKKDANKKAKPSGGFKKR
jgi:hypothetical protein